jgi:GAF domain-containing protein/anti-anti-sigma regulatory factor
MGKATNPEREIELRSIASLYEMTSALAAAIDLDEMLQIVLKQIRLVLEYDLCIVSLASPDGEVLRIRAVDGEEAEEMLGMELPADRGINTWIFSQGKPTLVDDADTDPRRLTIEGRTEAIRAAVGVPLIADGQPIGTIYAACKQPHSFSQEHLNFLTITATQVAAAIHRARLLDQARQRIEEMETLYTIGAVIAASLDIDHVLQTIYEQAGRIMDTSAFFVALYEPDSDELRFSLVYDRGERLDPFSVSFSKSKGLTAHVVRTAEPFLARNWELERDMLPIEPLVVGDPTLSWLGVPIIVQDQVLGAIGAQSYESHAFTNRQLRLLSAIANQAGISLQNARLYAALQEAHQLVADERDKLVHLHRVVADVQRATTLTAKLRAIADGIRDLGWGRVSVSRRDADLEVVELVCAGFSPEDEAELQASLLPADEWRERLSGEFERFRIGQFYYLPWSDPWVRENVRGVKSRLPEPEMSSGGEAWHPQDLLYVPLYGRGGRIVGIIGLDDPQDGLRPTLPRLHLIELFAQEAALSVENAGLLDELRLLNTDLREMVKAQAHLLQFVEELASPVVPIVDGVIVLPLMGRVDGRRASQILQTLLSGVQEHNAQVVILDITGVPTVDDQVAQHLMRSVQAAQLMGAEAILVGMRRDVAQALVSLNVELAEVPMCSKLQSGFQYALGIIGRQLAAGRESR